MSIGNYRHEGTVLRVPMMCRHGQPCPPRTPVLAESHADQVDRLAPVPVPVGMALFTDLLNRLLGDRILIVRPVGHPEFEYEHLAAVEHHQ